MVNNKCGLLKLLVLTKETAVQMSSTDIENKF